MPTPSRGHGTHVDGRSRHYNLWAGRMGRAGDAPGLEADVGGGVPAAILESAGTGGQVAVVRLAQVLDHETAAAHHPDDLLPAVQVLQRVGLAVHETGDL